MRREGKAVHLKSNVLKREKEAELHDAIREIAPELWGEDTRITLNKDVVCQKRRDGNEGHSWMLWLGDYTQGGELHFEDGTTIEGNGVWHRFQGQQAQWNTPHEGGTKYSVILYRSMQPSRYEVLLGYKKRKMDAAIAARDLEDGLGIHEGLVAGVEPTG